MFSHIVSQGESLWSIVHHYGLLPVDLAIEKIANYNKLHAGSHIQPRQSLVIPVHGLNYRLKQGDTLWLISKKFGVPIHQLAIYNNIDPFLSLRTGMIIRFPAIVCIDPGHQIHPDFGVEPLSPGSTIMKQKVSAGTQGVITGKPEYQLNLEVSLKIRDLLISTGYTVVMTRTTNNVNLSNIQRAQIANNANADLCLRVHADSSNNPKENGISVLYPSPGSSPYLTLNLYQRSIRAAQFILDAVVRSTGSNSKGIVPRSDITGFNWSIVPVSLIEMGFMSNPQEDVKMSTPFYQNLLAQDMVNGIHHFFWSLV